MANYIKYITVSKINGIDNVIFTLDNGDELKGQIINSNGWLFTTVWTLFDRIGLTDPMKFFIDIVGKENVKTGSWPYVKGEDNMRKVLYKLWDYKADRIPESKKVITSDDEKKPFALSIIRKKSLTLNFRI